MSNSILNEQSRTRSPTDNRLFGALSKDVQDRLFPHLELVTMPEGKILSESGDSLRDAYFPINCIVALLYLVEDDSFAEISMIGCEGLVGISLFMGGDTTRSRTVVQSAGYAFRLDGKILQDEFERHDELMFLILRYIQALITQMAQTAVCHRHHKSNQQLCRWLLCSLDRVADNCLAITQDLVGNMLSLGREEVTKLMEMLQKKGVISYSRAHIKVLDQPMLKKLSCECYEIVTKENQRLIPELGKADLK